jgi:hypothetical protein
MGIKLIPTTYSGRRQITQFLGIYLMASILYAGIFTAVNFPQAYNTAINFGGVLESYFLLSYFTSYLAIISCSLVGAIGLIEYRVWGFIVIYLSFVLMILIAWMPLFPEFIYELLPDVKYVKGITGLWLHITLLLYLIILHVTGKNAVISRLNRTNLNAHMQTLMLHRSRTNFAKAERLQMKCP